MFGKLAIRWILGKGVVTMENGVDGGDSHGNLKPKTGGLGDTGDPKGDLIFVLNMLNLEI